MALRVSTVEVKQIIEVEAGIDVLPFIETANNIVEDELVGTVLSADRLVQIELYLAAHFTSIMIERGQLRRTGTGDATEVYAGKFTQGFGLTRYGQMAMSLDTTGTLSDLSSAVDAKKKALFENVGYPA